MCSGFSRTAEQSEGFSHTIVVADAVRECGTIADGLACGVFAAEGADGLALFDGEGDLGGAVAVRAARRRVSATKRCMIVVR